MSRLARRRGASGKRAAGSGFMQQTEPFARYALCPKPESRRLAAAPPQGHELAFLAARLAPDERLALRQICHDGDLVLIDGQPFLLARVTAATLDALAAFESAAEDLEDDNEDRCAAADDMGDQPVSAIFEARDHEDAELDY